jgi:hypothetical protein
MPRSVTETSTKSIADKIEDGAAIEAALKRAFYKAVIRHRQGNVPMVFGENGKIYEVSPFDIPIPSDKK